MAALISERFILPTAAGAYFCVSGVKSNPTRNLIQNLLQYKTSPALTIQNLCRWFKIEDEDKALSLLERMQQLGWVQGLAEEKEVPKVDIEVFLPVQLKKLSQAGRALLADESGFLIAQTGFSDKTAAKLSALSADVFSMYERHEATLRETLSINKSAWAVVDAVGNSDIGFWPMWVGDQRFILVVKGVPLFNQDVLLDLIWALYVRYGN